MLSQEAASLLGAPEQYGGESHHYFSRLRQLAVRIGLAATMLIGSGVATTEMIVHSDPVAAAESGGYPDLDAVDCSNNYGIYSWCKNGSDISPRGYGYRNCTDWAAWKVEGLIGRKIQGLGNANTWDDRAPNMKFTVVHTNPEPGDVAVWNSGTYGHVAFVESVNKDGSVNISQYNKSGQGEYSTLPNQRADAYIDFNGIGKGLDNSTATSSPSEAKPFALKRGTGTEVFYRDTNDRLESAGFGSNGWTGPYPHSVGDMASNPVAVSRGTDSMDVFYRDYAGNVENIGWNAATGWSSPVPRVTDHSVSGDLGVISRSPDSMDVFYRNSSGNLVNIGWSALTGWHNAQTLVANGSVDGSPVAGRRGKNGMDVFYRDKNNNLEDIGWDASSGWGAPHIRAGNMKGNPAAIARTDGNVDVFFRDSHDGLDNAGWDVSSGWHNQILISGGVNSDPAALTRTGADMSIFYVDNGGKLKEESWSSTQGWQGSTERASGATGSPTAIARTDGNMDVFVRGNNGQLLNFWWDWQIGWSVGDPVKSGVRP